jgi:hypothetical protein
MKFYIFRLLNKQVQITGDVKYNSNSYHENKFIKYNKLYIT